MNNIFKIYTDRLREGQSEKIDLAIAPDLLLSAEKELTFSGNVLIKGEAYLAEQHLIFHLKIKALASMPCLVCNETVAVPLEIEEFYHAEPLQDIRSAIFDCSPFLREAIFLQLPSFVECHQGRCPERETLNKYLKPPSQASLPFKDLDKK
jgi:uncharacterized metal-binding protein YceD (DUF177 family)